MRILIWLIIFVSFNEVSIAQELISVQLRAQRSLSYMRTNYGPLMENGVLLYSITYTTTDVFGARDTASGLVVIPRKDEPFNFPTVCYHHGTVSDRNDVPSQLRGGFDIAEAFGGVGFVSIAPDYLGLGTSRGPHPYVHADSEASASIDMLFALREFAEQQEILLNDQLFLTGYSQGGHASMATHREIEQNFSDEFTVTAASHLSGPYSISGEMFDLILGDEPYNFAAYLPHTVLSYNYVYDLYDDAVEQVFNEEYIPIIRAFEREEIDLFQMNQSLLSMLVNVTGNNIVRNLMKSSFVQEVMDSTNHPLRMALRDNDVYDWAPQAPTRILYCRADDQVPFRNSVLADSVMNANAAPDVLAADLNSNFDHGQCVEPAIVNTVLFFFQYRELTVSTIDPKVGRGDFKMYPNPAQESLYFLDLKEQSIVRIFDVYGRICGEYKYDGIPLSIEHLMPGTYYIQVEQGRKVSGQFLVKQ